MNGERRVFVTGIGAITPIGSGACGLWEGVCRGISAVGPVTRFDASGFRSQLAAEIDDFHPEDHLSKRSIRKLDRFAQLGVAVARAAVDDALLDLAGVESSAAGVSIGSALGGVAFGEEQHVGFVTLGLRGVAANLATSVYGGASGANIAINLDLRGPHNANASSCASGAIALGEGMRAIQRGDADIMLAGGVEAPLAPLTYGAFSLIKAMSARNDNPSCASRPFDVSRDGFVMGEGAAVLVLEAAERAISRNAPVYAELTGYAQTNDAFHMTAPRPDGSEAARALTTALRDADVEANQIDYINAHATGTPLGDPAEALAFHLALGDHADRVSISGTKGLYGHALGASGAMEAAITCLAMRHGFLPGTTNLREPDPALGLDLLPPEGRRESVHHAVSTSFGFGGVNAALVFSQPEL